MNLNQRPRCESRESNASDEHRGGGVGGPVGQRDGVGGAVARDVDAEVEGGLAEVTGGPEAVGEAMLAEKAQQRLRLERNLAVLGTLGNNTPFIGLFGTVIGIIQAFHALSNSNASGPEVVMASISEALVATAVGLMVAIPAVIAFNVLSRAVKTKIANSETIARIVLSYHGKM